MVAQIAEFITECLATLGYSGLMIMMMLESMIAPVPSEVVMPFAGYKKLTAPQQRLGDFFLASVQWLAEEESLIELRPRARTSRPVVVARQQGRALMVVLAGLLPLSILAAGAVVWWRRR